MLAGSVLFFNSCTKSGPVGPQGPQGPQGSPGAQGNANVLGSDPFTVSSWSLTSDGKSYFASFTDPDITTAVADHGIVEIFLYYPSDNTWKNLPDILSGTQFSFRYSQGGFEIYYDNLDGSAPSFPGTFTFRTVVVAPSQKQAHPNTNWKNYNQAMTALNKTATTAGANN